MIKIRKFYLDLFDKIKYYDLLMKLSREDREKVKM